MYNVITCTGVHTGKGGASSIAQLYRKIYSATGMWVDDYFGVRMGDIFNQRIHRLWSQGDRIMTLNVVFQ